MNLHSTDLNLLVVFDAILRERQITAAADRLGLSQPAISNALARLRQIFNDPLFVRTTSGMRPTPFAIQLSDPIAHACNSARAALQLKSSFSPEKSSKTFTLCMSDIGEIVFLPPLLRKLREQAPCLNLVVTQVAAKNIQHGLESGDIDLAIGLFPNLQAGFYQQKLYSDRIVCVVRKQHTAAAHRFTIKAFMSLSHMRVAALGSGHLAAVEKAFGPKYHKRKITLSIPHFLSVPQILASTDIVATIPETLAEIFSHQLDLVILDPPFHMPKMEIKQHWHERYHHDPANKWMRGIVATLFMRPR